MFPPFHTLHSSQIPRWTNDRVVINIKYGWNFNQPDISRTSLTTQQIHKDITKERCFLLLNCPLTNNPAVFPNYIMKWSTVTVLYTGCPRRKGQNFGRVFLRSNYTDITQNTYIQSWTDTEIMAREVWNFDSCYTLTDYQIHIKTGRNMWFL